MYKKDTSTGRFEASKELLYGFIIYTAVFYKDF